MANNALIQGAARTGKKFLDVGAEVGKGLMLGAATNLMNQTPSRTKANEAIQQKVNGYMSKMKTDMDFTSFTPAETKSMRGFLLKERGKYTDAAKRAAQFKDTTSPEYLAEVDIMQGVNNSFTNLSSQLGSYKKGKVDYASSMQQGLYSKGNDPDRSRESMIAYGFYDGDGDGRSDSRYDSPFQIQEGGNIGFKVDGNVIDYSDMAEPFVKDTKFLNSLNSTSENAYDFKSEVKLDDVGNNLDNGTFTIEQAREEVKKRLLVARNQAFKDGKKEYDREQAKVNAPKQTSSQIAASKKVTKKLELLDNGQQITAMSGSALRTAKLAPWADAGGEGQIYYMTDDAGFPIEEKVDGKLRGIAFTRDEVIDKLNLYNK